MSRNVPTVALTFSLVNYCIIWRAYDTISTTSVLKVQAFVEIRGVLYSVWLSSVVFRISSWKSMKKTNRGQPCGILTVGPSRDRGHAEGGGGEAENLYSEEMSNVCKE